MKCIILTDNLNEHLYPLLNKCNYKHHSDMVNGTTLIQNIYKTASSLTSEKNIVTLSNIRNTDILFEILKPLSEKPIILSEPISKNTAAAIMCALTYLQSKKDELVLILPSNILIEDTASFEIDIKKAKTSAKKGNIVSFKINKSDFENGKQYLKKSKATSVTKRNQEIKKEEIFANSGIYISKISVLIDLLTHQGYKNLSKEIFDNNRNIKYEFYKNFQEYSIDYILEKAENTIYIELESKCKYFGSLQAIDNNAAKDAKNNSISGNVLLDDVKNSFISSQKEHTLVSGIKDTFIIETEDNIIVCDKSRVSEIPELVKKIKENNRLSAKTIFKTWGFYTYLNSPKNWISKIINITPKQKFSISSDDSLFCYFIITEGKADIILNESEHTLTKGEIINIPLKSKCTIQNNSDEILKILEIQKM